MSEERYHRICFYEGTFSTLDAVEKCRAPEFCIGCTYKHPFCTANGAVPKATQDKPEPTGKKAK